MVVQGLINPPITSQMSPNCALTRWQASLQANGSLLMPFMPVRPTVFVPLGRWSRHGFTLRPIGSRQNTRMLALFPKLLSYPLLKTAQRHLRFFGRVRFSPSLFVDRNDRGGALPVPAEQCGTCQPHWGLLLFGCSPIAN